MPDRAAAGAAPVFLALQAGGVAGIGHMGVARVLHALAGDYPIHTVVGSSAGSDAGALIASGMPDTEARDAVLAFPYADLERPSRLQRIPIVGTVIGGAANLVLQQGLYDGDRIRKDIAPVLAAAGIRVFADYDRKVAAGVPNAARLAVVAWDVNRGVGLDTWRQLLDPRSWVNGSALRLIADTFSRKEGIVVFPEAYASEYGITDPQKQSVAEAVRASSSIPFFFSPAHLNGHLVVDGGVGAMLPHDQAVELAKASGATDWRVLNVALGGVGAAPGVSLQKNGPLTKAIVEGLRAEAKLARDLLLADPEKSGDTIVVDTVGVSATQFQLTRDQQLLLYDSGVVSATQFVLNDRGASLTAADRQTLLDLMRGTKTELDALVRVADAGRHGLDASATRRIDAAAAAVLQRLTELGTPGVSHGVA